MRLLLTVSTYGALSIIISSKCACTMIGLCEKFTVCRFLSRYSMSIASMEKILLPRRSNTCKFGNFLSTSSMFNKPASQMYSFYKSKMPGSRDRSVKDCSGKAAFIERLVRKPSCFRNLKSSGCWFLNWVLFRLRIFSYLICVIAFGWMRWIGFPSRYSSSSLNNVSLNRWTYRRISIDAFDLVDSVIRNTEYFQIN